MKDGNDIVLQIGAERIPGVPEGDIERTREDGKTYCFSNDRALESFMKDATANLKKAERKPCPPPAPGATPPRER